MMLAWLSNIPREPGYYWFQHYGTGSGHQGDTRFFIAEVKYNCFCIEHENTCELFYNSTRVRDLKMRWAGPLPIPDVREE